MSSLHDLQTKFRQYAFSGQENDLPDTVLSKGLNATQRLQVYRNNIQFLMTDALKGVFDVIEKLVGDAFFKQLCRDYISAHPSRSGDLHLFGEHMAEFIKSYKATDSLPYLADIARFEWAYHEVFHDASCKPRDIFQKIATIAPEQHPHITFSINPASRLLSSNYPVYDIWDANVRENDQMIEINNNSTHYYLISRRQDNDIYVQTLNVSEYQLLALIEKRAPLMELAHAIESMNDLSLDQFLIKHVQIGNIVDCEVIPV